VEQKTKEYTAFYWRYKSLLSLPCESVKDCIDFFIYGCLENGDGYPERIEKGGVTVMEQKEIMDNIYKLEEETYGD
jgi:hypothetical protein